MSKAAKRLGIHPMTLRQWANGPMGQWADSDKIPVTWVGRERRFSSGEVVRVFKDRGSGLGEDRPGLNRLIALVSEGSVRAPTIRSSKQARLFALLRDIARQPGPAGDDDGSGAAAAETRPGMTYAVIWEAEATGLLSRYLDDLKGVAEVLDPGEALGYRCRVCHPTSILVNHDEPPRREESSGTARLR